MNAGWSGGAWVRDSFGLCKYANDWDDAASLLLGGLILDHRT